MVRKRVKTAAHTELQVGEGEAGGKKEKTGTREKGEGRGQRGGKREKGGKTR